jgi:excisionase family DNA binding protein
MGNGPSRSSLTVLGGTAHVVPLLYSVEDAATAMAIGRTSLYELIAAGELRTVRVGRRPSAGEGARGVDGGVLGYRVGYNRHGNA